jgi:hypothetical protein
MARCSAAIISDVAGSANFGDLIIFTRGQKTFCVHLHVQVGERLSSKINILVVLERRLLARASFFLRFLVLILISWMAPRDLPACMPLHIYAGAIIVGPTVCDIYLHGIDYSSATVENVLSERVVECL